jgi:hypothetical protein
MFRFLFSFIGKVIITVIVVAGAWAAYIYLTANQATPPTLPNLPGYNTIEGQEVTAYISSLGDGATLLGGNPELAEKAAAVDRLARCYQEAGAVQIRGYSKQEMPLSAGVVTIVDRNAVLNPRTLIDCLNPPAMKTQSLAPAIEPCSANYTVSRDDNEYHILYAGTTLEICQAFCSQLEGCTAH